MCSEGGEVAFEEFAELEDAHVQTGEVGEVAASQIVVLHQSRNKSAYGPSKWDEGDLPH